jgi:hypothetical protein
MSIIGVCMIIIALLVGFHKPDGVLAFVCIAVIAFQGSLGSASFPYAAEVMVDSALGAALTVLFGLQAIQSLVDPTIIGDLGISNTFYIFGGFQIVTVIILFLAMKETKGLDS